MAQVTPGLRREFGPMIGMVPADVLKSIGDDELADRLHQARALVQKSQAAALPGDGRRLGEQAQAILGARPRAEIERLVVDKISKAAVTADPGQAHDLRAQARQLLLQEPPAVRRRGPGGQRIAKAAAKPEPGPSGLIALYDAAGNIAYAINADSPDLIPVVSIEDAGMASMGSGAVSKARRQAPRSRPGR